jgi:hypothetical protein
VLLVGDGAVGRRAAVSGGGRDVVVTVGTGSDSAGYG